MDAHATIASCMCGKPYDERATRRQHEFSQHAWVNCNGKKGIITHASSTLLRSPHLRSKPVYMGMPMQGLGMHAYALTRHPGQ
eukprot:324334-Chlamydomonas_euryale.AAC.6